MRRNQESPLRKSLDRIDSMSTLAYQQQQQSVYTPKKNTVNVQSRPISAQRYSSNKVQNQLSNGFSTPLRNSSGYSNNNYRSSKNGNNNSQTDFTSATRTGSTYNNNKSQLKRSGSQSRQSQSGNKIIKLNSSGNGLSQNMNSVMEMSPTKRGVQQTSQSVLFHTNIAATNVKYTHNAADKTHISKLGLKLQPICTKEGHERSKVSYVCTDLLCMNEQKFGCAHCFLEGHGEHAMRKMRLDEFVNSIENKHTQYIESVCNLANLAHIMSQPHFLNEMLIQMDRIKENFIQRIDNMKERVKNHIFNELQSDNLVITGEVEKQQLYLNSLRTAMQKNLFEMTDSEFGYALNIHHDTFASDLMKRTKVIQDRYDELNNKYISSFQQMESQLNDELDRILSSYDEFDTLLEQEQPYPNSTTFISQNCSPIQSNKRISNNGETYISTQPSKICDDESSSKQKSEEGKINQLLAKKESHENILKNNVKLIEELQTIQRDINYLSTKNNFPYTIFSETCGHTIKCNTIPIFECCKQAYQCTLCHDNSTNHKHVMTNPSKRYCQKCFKVFNVKYFTNVAINCKDCLSVKIKK